MIGWGCAVIVVWQQVAVSGSFCHGSCLQSPYQTVGAGDARCVVNTDVSKVSRTGGGGVYRRGG